MSGNNCTPIHQPVVVFATHDELLRSARDMWAVTVSLLTELTPDKFVTAPWAAALFTGELPFILAKLYHIQQGLITSAHSYMETESMLTTFLETIDITKILRQLGTWSLDLAGGKQLPKGVTQHVPSVEVMQPGDVNIIHQRFHEVAWTKEHLIRHESYALPNNVRQHWFYIPHEEMFGVKLNSFIESMTDKHDQVLLISKVDGELVIPNFENQNLSGEVSIFKLENAQSLEDTSA